MRASPSWSNPRCVSAAPNPAAGPPLEKVVALLKDRASTIPQLADEAMLFYAVEVNPGTPDWDEKVGTALRMLKARLATVKWERAALNDAIKEVVKSSGLKMPQIAMPLRRLVTGPHADALRSTRCSSSSAARRCCFASRSTWTRIEGRAHSFIHRRRRAGGDRARQTGNSAWKARCSRAPTGRS